MALTRVRRWLMVLLTVIFLATPSAIYSCGPFFEATIFSFNDQPEAPQEDFAAGKLAIVRPSFRQSYLVIAYRYLSGRTLTSEQQKAAQQVWAHDVVPEHPGEDEALAAWNKARDKVGDLPPAPAISADAFVSKDQPYEKFLNCPGEAFTTAVRTLEDRTVKYASPSALHDWTAAQDQVFGNCGGETRLVPASLNSGEPLWRADRIYQIAAAQFYAREFDAAVSTFDAIAQDHASPWAEISPYLAARALIRKGVLVHAQGEPFDRTALVAAQERLQRIVNNPHAGRLHDPALKLLNFVRFRTEPAKRVAELDGMVVSANPGPNFKQDLWDYVLLLSHGGKADDPSEWVQTYYAPDYMLNRPQGQPTRAEESVARWREAKSLPWLVAALTFAKPNDAALRDLLGAAGQLPASSPGYITVRYQALRLMIASGQGDPARTELDALLKKQDIPLGARNLFNEERQTIATNLGDFLQHAAEEPLSAELNADTAEEVPATPPENKPRVAYFNRYPAQVLVRRLPVAILAQSAASPSLPRNLLRELARTTWARAVLVGDWDTAAKLQAVLQELDAPLWKSMAPFREAKTADEKRFAAHFIILSNPGLKPAVREGELRRATLGEIDQYRDNWWCADMALNGGENSGAGYSEYNQNVNLKFVERDPDFPFPGWLSDAEKAATRAEVQRLAGVGTAPNYLASQVIDYARRHSDDARVPQALCLAVRSTRYGCTNAGTSKLSKAAFDFLHEHYPQSEWAGKTKYYY